MNLINQYKTMLALLLALLFLQSQAFASDEETQGIKIVASVKPLALLIQEIINDEDIVQVLLEDKQNHHLAQLKPSQKQRVAEADIVFYISDNFESFVRKIKKGDRSRYKYIEMSKIQGLRLLSVRQSGEIPHSAHNRPSKKYKTNGHSHAGIDWHLWLNPDNAMVMLMTIRDELTKIRPENAELYQERYDIFSQHLIRHSMKKAKMMMDVLDAPFFVLHDGLQYFEEQFGLQSSGIILRDEENSASPRHLLKLRKIRKAKGVNIVIKEEQYSDRMINTLAGDKPFKVINVDSLAQGSLSNVEDYIEYTDSITTTVFAGLNGQ